MTYKSQGTLRYGSCSWSEQSGVTEWEVTPSENPTKSSFRERNILSVILLRGVPLRPWV